MPKRLTDSDKWQDPWFMDLPSKYKLLWLYLLDSCDHAGIWKVNFKVASFCIGENLEPSEVKRIVSGRINFIDDEYWQIRKFVDFQYGGIKNDSVGKSVAKILQKHGLLNSIEGLPSPYEGTIDKDKVMDKDKTTLGTGKNYFVVIPKDPNAKRYRIQGTDGFQEYMETHSSAINFPHFSEKFMRDRNGKQFNDFMHVWNDFNSYVQNQSK